MKVGDLVRNNKKNKIGVIVAKSKYPTGYFDWQVAYIIGDEISWSSEDRLELLECK